MNHIDTAEMYDEAEEIVADAVAGCRDEVFLVSKVLPQNASHAGVIAACERSLARLRTDRLDCYLLHWRGQHPLADTIAAFEQIKIEGKILSWGVSNFDVPDLEEVLKLAGNGSLTCNQVLYNLQERAVEHEVLPWCIEHGVAVVAYSPFGRGTLPGPGTAAGRVLEEIAATRGATPHQVAVGFVTHRPSIFVIPKAVRHEHVVENAGASGLKLSEAELARLDAVFPRGPRPRELPMM